MPLSQEEFVRYSRHLKLPKFGIEAQEKLKESSVLVVGTGGLGAPLLQYLTAAGVGTIGVVDFDVIDMSNLQRQVLFGNKDIGQSKTAVAINKLREQNPLVNFVQYDEKLVSANSLDIIKEYDVVADGTDNFPTRYLVNDACVLAGKTNVYASIYQFEGQVSVFNFPDKDGNRGPNYRDLFPEPPPPGMVPSCAEGGVLGILPGIIGCLQANEVIKVVTGIGETLSGRLFVFDALDFSFRTLKINKDPKNPLSGENPTQIALIDYEEFCGLKEEESLFPGITVDELKSWNQIDKDFKLIDVREPYEYNSGNLGGTLIPMDDVETSLKEIPKDKDVVICCRSGIRSAMVIEILMDKYGYDNLYNLKGGIAAWKEQFQPDLVVL